MILSWLNSFVVGVVFSRARDQIGSRLPESPGGARSTERPSVPIVTVTAWQMLYDYARLVDKPC